jgi:hypothetical protein
VFRLPSVLRNRDEVRFAERRQSGEPVKPVGHLFDLL